MKKFDKSDFEKLKKLHLIKKIKNRHIGDDFDIDIQEAAPKKELTEKQQKIVDFCNKYSLVITFIAAFVLYFVMEALSRHSVSATFVYLNDHTKAYFYNTLLIYMTLLIPYFFRRRTFVRIVIGTIWLALGVINSILLANRVTPLTGPDLGSITEAASIVTKYLSVGALIVFVIAVLLVIAAIVWLFRHGHKFQGKIKYKIIAPAFICAVLLFWGLTTYCLNNNILTLYFDNIAYCYQDYGLPYCFSVTVLDQGISQPNNYSEESVQEIIAKTEDAGTTDITKYGKPNIIVVQCETFFDVSRLKNISYSSDPIPNWHKLCEEYTSGYLTVPVVGAGTANTEFEVLTGMSMRYFGAGETPYKGILKEKTCESAAFDLRKLGYRTTAIHDNEANFYSRRTVYSRLGFNTFTSEEYMDTQDDVNYNGWMRDMNLVKYINNALDSTYYSKDFVFTVSVQPHGSYPTEQVLEDPEIQVSGAADEETGYAWEYYINQIHEEDEFIQALIDSVSERDEPTVILFYGDHLPTMNLSDSDLTDGTIYQTDYLLWDNIGLEQEDKDLYSYTLMADLFDRLDIHEGTLFRYHQTMQDDPNYLTDLQTLQYDLLYGKRYAYGDEYPFSKTNIKLGSKSIYVNSVEQISDNTYYVHGKNFTQSSKVLVDDDMMDTIYIDSTTLLFKTDDSPQDCEVTVAQQSNSSTHKILSRSNTIIPYDLEDEESESTDSDEDADDQSSRRRAS